MRTQTRKPSWWVLLVILFGMIGLLLLEGRDGAPPGLNEVLAFAIVVIAFGAMMFWVNANLSALNDEDMRESYGELRIHEYPPSQPRSDSAATQSNQLPETARETSPRR